MLPSHHPTPTCDCPDCGTPWQAYASLFDRNPQPMWVFDRETLRFLEVNRAAVARYGYSREEFLELSLLDIRPPEDVALLTAELARWEGSTGPYSCQWRHRVRDGSLVDVAVSADFVDWLGRAACVVTVLDLTPQRAAERRAEALMRDLKVERARLREIAQEQRHALHALRGSEERFALLSHNIPQVFWISGEAAQGVIYVSPHFENVFGLSGDALLAGTTSIVTIMDPEDVPAFHDATARQRRGETTVVTYRIHHPTNGLRYIEDRAFPVLDDEGRVFRIAGIAKDITERREAVQALELERTKLQTVLDNLPVMVAFFEPAGTLQLSNRCLTRALGWTESDGIELATIAQLHPDVAERARLTEFIGRADGSWDEFDAVARDGSLLRTLWAYVKLPDGSTLGIGQDISELKRHEHELRLSEARFRLLVEGSAQVLFFVHDMEGRFEYVSPSSVPMFGYTPEELVGRRYSDVLSPEATEDVHRRTDAALSTGLSQPTYQAEVLHRDGRRRVIELTEEPITRDSRVVGMQGFARDITDRVAAEAALRESQERLHAIVNTVTEGLVIVSPTGSIGFANPAAERILGLPRAELALRVYDDPAWRITKADGAAVPAGDLPFARVMRTNEPVQDVEHAIEHADGRRVILSVNAAPMHDMAGAISGVVTSVRDVTERHRAQQDLRALHARLVAIVDTSPLGIVMVDTLGAIQVWNRAAESIFGWSAEEVIGRQSPVRGADGSPVELGDVRSALLADPLEGAEVQRLARDGRILSLSMWTAPLRDSEDRLTGLVFLIADVSERKHLEEQLRQAQKMEAVGRLAGGVAHDFNNVLTSILGHADLLLERVPGAARDLYDDLAEIRKGAERARSLTQQLLAFSRRQIVQPRVLDADATVRDMWRMLLHLTGENVRLVRESEEGLWPVLMDRGQLEQVMLNLVVNARDALRRGGTIRVRLRNVVLDETTALPASCPGTGEYLSIEVSDDGTGIDPAVLPYIFEPFFTTKELGKGTGLGLATVYGIVAQNGGCVTVDSELGVGSVFRLYLPRVTDPVAASEDRPPVAAEDEAGSETVLLVEDEPAVRALASRVLARRGYTVLEASNGEDALEILERDADAIDLVLTDMVMPGMSGRELVQKVAARRPDLPVIFMSGYTEEIIGGDDVASRSMFLEKPFAPAALTAAVRRTLAASRRSGSAG